MQTFDDLDNENYALGDLKPFQFRDDKTDEGTLKWLNDNFNKTYEGSMGRLLMYRKYVNRYKNYDARNADGLVSHGNAPKSGKKPKVKVNFYYDLVESKVASSSRMKINTVFIPANDSEQTDRNNAMACNMLAKHRLEELKFEKLMRDQDRKTFIFGTSFAYVYWDKAAGPKHPAYLEALKKYPNGKIPKINEAGDIVGYFKPNEVAVGDVCVEILSPDRIFPERLKHEWHKINHLDIIEEWMHIDEAKQKWKGKAEKIEKNEKTYYSSEHQDQYVPEDMVMIRTFWHKPTEFFPGCKITYCDSCILEWVDFPYAHGQLPIVPDFDIEVPNELWARPFLVNIEQLSNMYDLIQSGTARNIGVASHPKLAIPEGSVNTKELDNEFGNLFFRGPTAPQWIQHQYVNRGEFEIQDRLEKRMGQLAGRFEISQGFVPNGITAYSAIRYLDDQEVQRNSNTISKRRERILAIYRQVISLMAQYYTEEDGRTVKILGRNNEYLIKSFKNFDFSKIYDVKLENVSALSDTRSGRIADIMDLNASNQKDPLFGRKEMVKLLDLGLDDAFKTESSYAADTARTLLDMLLEGEEAPAPESTDDLLEMYQIFARYVESPAYKLKLDKQIKVNLNKYINGLEYMMWEKAQKTPAFMQELLMLPKYPMFFVMPNPLAPAMPAAPGAVPTPPTLDTSKMTNTQKNIEQSMNTKE
jgi:hypothetical protein